MKREYFTEPVLDRINEKVFSLLNRLGVPKVDLSLEVDERSSHNDITIMTSSFQTMPAIYEAAHVYGYGKILGEDKPTKSHRLRLSLFYGVKCFACGDNGVRIGDLFFNIEEEGRDGAYAYLDRLNLEL